MKGDTSSLNYWKKKLRFETLEDLDLMMILGEISEKQYKELSKSFLVQSKVSQKICDSCGGKGNFCQIQFGKSVCGLCMIEGKSEGVLN